MLEDADIMIIAYGSVSLGVTEAINRMRKEGIKVGMLDQNNLAKSCKKESKN